MLRGKPLEALPAFWRKHGVTTLVFESDTEPYAKERDAAIRALAEADGLAVESPCGHTLYDPAVLLSLCRGKMPISYKVRRFSIPPSICCPDCRCAGQHLCPCCAHQMLPAC